jgi:hypothetical protein
LAFWSVVRSTDQEFFASVERDASTCPPPLQAATDAEITISRVPFSARFAGHMMGGWG